jgi:small subunit ribosomal protein S6e
MFEVDTVTEARLYDKEVGSQFSGDILGEEFEGCVFEITGGDDVLGLPMVRGRKTKSLIRPLLSAGDVGYRCRRKGTRMRKSVRGSIVSEEIGVLSLKLVEPGQKEIGGLTDVTRGINQLPTRESRLRAMFEVPDECEDTISYIKQYLSDNELTLGARLPKDDKYLKLKEKKRAAHEEGVRRKEASRKRLEEERAEYERKYLNKD